MKASKSDAIHMLKDHFHVKQEEIMAFGDNFNDIDMIRYAAVSYTHLDVYKRQWMAGR